MTTPLDDVDWLTRSENRVSVLEALIEERRERSALQELTGVSRVTSNRMLAELEDRNWIRRDGHEYEITATGRLVVEDLDRLLDTIETGQKVGDIQQYLPTEEFDFDLRRLHNARITRPTTSNTIAPLNRIGELFRSADERLWAFVSAFDMVAARAAEEVCMENDGTSDAILTTDAVETVMSNQEMADVCARMSEAGASFYQYDGEDPLYSPGISNDTVHFELNDGEGGVPAVIETDDEAVLTWSEEAFERYKRESEPLAVEDFDV